MKLYCSANASQTSLKKEQESTSFLEERTFLTLTKTTTMSTVTIESILSHPVAVANKLINKNRLFNYLNKKGYVNQYHYKLNYHNYENELNHIKEFLDTLQQEEEQRNQSNTLTLESILSHPIAVANKLVNRSRLFTFLNRSGYEERYNRKLSYFNYENELNHMQEFLDALQQEEELTNWLNTVEVEQTTQRPHHVRELEHNISEGLQWLFDEARNEDYFHRDIEEHQRKLDEGFEQLKQYVNDETQTKPNWIDIEWTALLQDKEDKLTTIQNKLLE